MRFGIVCAEANLAEWQAQTVNAILKLGKTELALVIIEPRVKTGLADIGFSHLLFEAYRKSFARPRAQKKRAEKDWFSDVPRLVLQSSSRKFVPEHFSDEDVERIRGYDLDFILTFDCIIPRGKVLTAARYGVWSFHHGDMNHCWGHPPGFWEIYHREPVTGAVLQRIGEQPGSGIVLRKGFFRTQNSSYARNLQLILSESSRWPAQVCRDILENQASYLEGPSIETQGRMAAFPNNRETITFVAKILIAKLKSTYRLFFRYSFWNIGVVEEPIERFLDRDYVPRIDWLPRPPKGEFKADPFGMLASAKIHVFYENLDYHSPKGIIYTVDVADGTFATAPSKMIELPVHMSYPFLVQHEGQIYCIPETNRAREISVYKAVEFPVIWKREGALLENVMAIDTTIFQHEGAWWMMFTDRQRGGDANLYVWYAADFWGPWKPHMNNPVKSDVRSVRPGGTPFYHDGFLYRPAQDCSTTGGGRIVINRIRRLTPSQFEEEEVASVEPDRNGPYPEGLHTLSQVGRFTLVDGKKFEFSIHGLFNNIVKGIRRSLDHE